MLGGMAAVLGLGAAIMLTMNMRCLGRPMTVFLTGGWIGNDSRKGISGSHSTQIDGEITQKILQQKSLSKSIA